MTGSDEEFERRLLETFREEAEEYLDAITEGLVELERAGASAGLPLIESVYRKTHSLKGAARAVNLRTIESVCQNIENIFALMKQGGTPPDAETYDRLHQAVTVVRMLLAWADDPSVPTTEVIAMLRESRLLLDGGKSVGAAAGPSPGQMAHPGQKDTAPEPKERGTVRIAAHKLDRLIAGADALLTTRLFLTQRMLELEDMFTRFSLWQWNYAQVGHDLRQLREATSETTGAALPPAFVLPLERTMEFLEYNREFVRLLQHDLGSHMRGTELDRSALEASTSEISDLIHDAVLVPIASILTPFSGFVREFSRTSGKAVEFIVEGGEVEVDRRILEAVADPLRHLIRNSIDHGIERPETRVQHGKPPAGTIRIWISPLTGSSVRIEVADDGRGIDGRVVRRAAVGKGLIGADEAGELTEDAAMRLIFRSGLSTSPFVTEISGRGLGLSIVEESVTRLGGTVGVVSTVGEGTTFTLAVPVNLATLRGVVVRSGRQIYVVPMQSVRQVSRVRREAILQQDRRPAIRFQGEVIEAIRLHEALGAAGASPLSDRHEQIPVVILSHGAGRIACMVDEVIRVQEIVVRPLGSQLRCVRLIEGAVILGNGNVALVLDPLELVQEALAAERSPLPAGPTGKVRRSVLVVEDSVTSRSLLQNLLERAGYYVETAADGMEGFAILKKHEFDIVISDVDMPVMDGFTLTEKIRANPRLARLPVVLVTSLDLPEDRDHGIAIGADAYIVKAGFKQPDLLDIIDSLMRGRH
ncbi:response regulator [Methanoculleus sp. FWC-SCC1]|uniref:histidine kinase n=1 Tax=Methanoculleus frigidifontis TaxID=2584085 RepID=A0ABT8M6V9_9EURY|nr:response regulator [Methanoculleus sp. FWC-SCC1]MDN7023656.1 response regulator [Methanoculleus sp. FWC-SCC1]